MHTNFIILVVVGALFTVQCQNTENIQHKVRFVRSHYSLSQLALHEMRIYRILRHQSDESPDLMDYFSDYEDSSGQLAYLEESLHQRLVADHPLLSFRLIYRYATKLPALLKDTYISGIRDTVNVIDTSVGWPSMDDFDDTLIGIIRLQYFYDLPMFEFVSGDILGMKTGFGLRAIHCLTIGKFAVSQRYYAAAVNWVDHVRTLIFEESDTSVEPHVVQTELNSIIALHNREWDTAREYDPLFFAHKIGPVGVEFPNRVTRRNYYSSYWKGQRGRHFNEVNFWNLCSGQDLRTEEEKSRLFCWYDTTSNPVWTINPLKVEQLASTPFVLQYYEVLSESKIQAILREGQSRLRKSPLYIKFENSDKTWNTRTSATLWLDESTIPELVDVPRLIELITGLSTISVNSSETLHLASYSHGSHYEVHRDALEKQTSWLDADGDRMATFMIYLNDVKLGGFTAFPQAGIAARPEKGSAILWYNLKRNGNTEEHSYHGACPLIYGNKWIATKWIHAHAQFRNRPCSLQEDE